MDNISLLKEKIKKLSQDYQKEKKERESAVELSDNDQTAKQQSLSEQSNKINKTQADELTNKRQQLGSVLYEWRAPLRPYKRFNFKVLRFFLAFTLLIGLLFYLFNAYSLLLTFITVIFLIFAFLITPPPAVTNRISLFGIETGDLILHWENFSFFYVEKKFDFFIINLFLYSPVATKIMLVVESEEEKNLIVDILSSVLPYKKNVNRSLFDKFLDFFEELVADNQATSKRVASS
ncbi:MAG: hypothetical protein KatS3mg091_219 [Patescibacteria group bacterium]|nr:MAG: hypothetical protein KatS3mg091_219 [Patescibacteria group bacterium]